MWLLEYYYDCFNNFGWVKVDIIQLTIKEQNTQKLNNKLE